MKELPKKVKEALKKFEDEHGARILYLTEYGSKLYGTNNPNSDTDYKGIYVQNTDDILLKKDAEHWTSNSNDSKEKNDADDIDLQLFSIHKFFELLRKGETGGLDILFSMWSPSIVFEDETFTGAIKENYPAFLNKKLHSFVGYAVGQATKYGVKGSRYKELVAFNECLNRTLEDKSTQLDQKLEVMFDAFKAHFKKYDTKYLKMTQAQGPKTGKGENMIDYVEILGKKFSGDITLEYFLDKAQRLEEQFGNRTKASTEGTDWKALSHSVRVLHEVEELLDTGFIKMPLDKAPMIKMIKEGKVTIDTVMNFINNKLDVVKEKLDNSNLPEKSNRELMDEMELIILKEYFKGIQ